MEKTFTRVRSIKDIAISSSIIICGAVLTALPDSDSLNIFGFVLLFTGLILILVLRSAYKDEETGAKYQKKERFFETCHRESLTNLISGKARKVDLSAEDKGNGLRLDIYHSQQTGKAYVQLYEYVPYKYEPCTSMHEHDIENVTELIGR